MRGIIASGAYIPHRRLDRSEIAAQKKGQALWPPVDVDPLNPTGVENDFPLMHSN
mgnify:CR=1 FL=1